MIIYKAYKFRLYPTSEQQQILKQHVGNARFIWNHFLRINKESYEKTKKFIFTNQLNALLPKLKKEFPFLKGSIALSLQQVSVNFNKALKEFILFQKGFPKFKKKKYNGSFTILQGFKIRKKYIKIPKINKIKYKKCQIIKGIPKKITISQDGDQWNASILCKLKIKDKEKKYVNIVGVDMGIKTYTTHSDGNIIENPKILKKYERNLKKENKKLSKKIKNSKNRAKQLKKLQKIHRKINNVRKDFQHKTTHNIIAKYDVIVLEDLNIKGMMKNHKLAKAIFDCAWYEYKRQLKYKALWNYKTIIEINRFEATNKTCSCCGWKDINLTLNNRIFNCIKCGYIEDRDINAAINIKQAGEKYCWVGRN